MTSRYLSNWKLVFAASLAAGGMSSCAAESDTEESPVAEASSAISDTNAKLCSTVPQGGGAAPSLSLKSGFADWSKGYDHVVALSASRVAFIQKLGPFLPGGPPGAAVRVVDFSANGAATAHSVAGLPGVFSDVIAGNFGGNVAQPDLLFFDRGSGTLTVREVAANGTLTPLFSFVVPTTTNGGHWDIITSGFLGASSGRDDILVYNKAEGKARIYTVGANGALTVRASYTGWRRNWDHIIPGRIDGDGLTDFAFYNVDGGGVVGSEDVVERGNGFNGHVKFLSFADPANPAIISESFDAWPMYAHTIVVPGQFGGDSKTDFLVYEGQPDAATTRATYWINDGTGHYSPLPTEVGWQGRWTNILALNTDGGTTSDLFFYTRQVEVELLLVIDDATTYAAADVADAFTDWMVAVNRAYAPAGIHFSVDPDVQSFDMDDVNGTDATSPVDADGKYTNCYDPDAESALQELTEDMQATHPNRLIVLVRQRGAGGCGSPENDFVVMPPPRDSGKTAYRRDGSSFYMDTNPKLFAHELGHFFSLGHSQPEIYLSPQSDRYAYDPDASPGGTWADVFDTPPNPSTVGASSPWNAAGLSVCDDSGMNDIAIAGSGFSAYSINPERHEIMSKGLSQNCDFMYRVTPDQALAIHTNLWLQRSYLLP